MTTELTPKHLSKQEFGRRVYQLMNAKGWRQSELARRSNLNRAAISTYVNGKARPTATSLKALADALSVAPDELYPNHTESAIEQDDPSFELKVSPGAPNTAWVRVNRLVSLATAVKIAGLLESDDTSHRIGSGGKAALQHVESEEIETDGSAGVLPRSTSVNRGKRAK